jgi:ubiquinone/menaquinone biosynthesis C-methylase UbiE
MAYVLDPDENETRAIHDLVTFAGKDVLEIGSGEGRLTWRFAHNAASVLALDLDQTRIKGARDNTPDALQSKLVFQVADITTLELPEAAFDVAVLSWSL